MDLDSYTLAPRTEVSSIQRIQAEAKIRSYIQRARDLGKYAIALVAMEFPLVSKDKKSLKSVGGRGGGQKVYMGDVPWAVSTKGVASFVFKPLFQQDVLKTYGSIEKFLNEYDGVYLKDIEVEVGGGTIPLHVIYVEQEGVPVILLYDPSGSFFNELYADSDNLVGYIETILLSKAPILIAHELGIQYEAYQFNDWQTGFGPLYIDKYVKEWKLGFTPAVLFTTHNLEYQGLFSGHMEYDITDPMIRFLMRQNVIRFQDDPNVTWPNAVREKDGKIKVDIFRLTNLPYELQFDADSGLEFWSRYPDSQEPGGMKEIYGRHNIMKGAYNHSDRIIFVSEGHLKESLTPERGYGLEGLLRKLKEQGVLTALYNGIRADKHRPVNLKALKKDGFIPEPDENGLTPWKEHNRQALQEKFNLDSSNPKNFIVGVVTRIVKQKGLNILFTPIYAGGPRLIDALLDLKDESTGAQLQFVLLGTAGDEIGKELVQKFEELERDNFIFINEYDPELAKQIGAGSMAGLMPSIDEPGGLSNQEMSELLTPMIVTARGGLNDFYLSGGTPIKPVPGFEINDTPEAEAERIQSAAAIYEAIKTLFETYIQDSDTYEQYLAMIDRYDPDWGERINIYDHEYQHAIQEKAQQYLAETFGKIQPIDVISYGFQPPVSMVRYGLRDNRILVELAIQTEKDVPMKDIANIFRRGNIRFSVEGGSWSGETTDIAMDRIKVLKKNDAGQFILQVSFDLPMLQGNMEFSLKLEDIAGNEYWFTEYEKNFKFSLAFDQQIELST